jgi:hypothetical protein
MHGVVNRVEIELLGALGQLCLAVARAVFRGRAQLEVPLGRGRDDVASSSAKREAWSASSNA